MICILSQVFYNSFMPKEIEAKFKVTSFTKTKKLLARAGAILVSHSTQTDHYFDNKNQDMLKAGVAVRLRITTPAKLNVPPLLTYKGPAGRTGKAKTRTEIQTAIDNEKAIVQVLAAAELKASFVIQKKRDSYKLGRCEIELDELPLAGKFVEIEAPSTAEISKLQKLLELPGPAITDHYVKIVSQACKAAGKQCNEITFDKCGKC